MTHKYILKRRDGTFYGTKVDRVVVPNKEHIGECRMYSDRDLSEFGKEWAPYFTFVKVYLYDYKYSFA